MKDETKQSRIRQFFRRLRQWIGTHRVASLAIGGSILVLIAAGITFALLSQKMPEIENYTPTPIAKTDDKPLYYSPLTGLAVSSEAETKMPVTAIMIENSPDARPQSGLKKSGIVYEAIAEGGITRFLTLHQQDKPQLIGPVRSLRMYYVDWLAPYNASVAHIGGSAAALKEVRGGKYRDIDQFFNSAYYWRSTDRYAPHNVYTSFKKLDALNKAKGYKTSSFTGFSRADEKPAEKVTANSVTINFSGPLFNTSYKYDKKNNRYTRYIAGAPHKDREDGTITPKVVIAMKVSMQRVFEDGYREAIKTTGSGEAIIFQNGTAQKVKWYKASRASQITFTDSKGVDVPLVRGQTWIAAVPTSGGGVSWK